MLLAGKITASLMESTISLPLGLLYHWQADCLRIGISAGPSGVESGASMSQGFGLELTGIQFLLVVLPLPDDPMCTVCTRVPTTLEAPPPGKRENCHAIVCH